MGLWTKEAKQLVGEAFLRVAGETSAGTNLKRWDRCIVDGPFDLGRALDSVFAELWKMGLVRGEVSAQSKAAMPKSLTLGCTWLANQEEWEGEEGDSGVDFEVMPDGRIMISASTYFDTVDHVITPEEADLLIGFLAAYRDARS